MTDTLTRPVATRTISYGAVSTFSTPPSGAALAASELLSKTAQGWAIDKLVELLMLKPGWNGHGAPPPTDIAARVALQVLGLMPNFSISDLSIVPTNRGGIGFEWHGNGVDVEVEISSKGAVECYLDDDNDVHHAEGKLIPNLSIIHRALHAIR